MNYFSSVIGMYSCPEEAGYARYSVQVCDSLANNAKVTGYKDIMAVADLSAYSYFYTQLYVTMLHKINGHKDFKDRDLGYPLQNLGLLRYVNEKGAFTEEELTKIYFAFDAVCFYKSYYGYLMSLTYDDTQRKNTHEKLIEYAYYIDEVSGPFFEAVYADKYQPLKMTNDEFEAFMLKASEIKVDIMRLLTEQFQLIAKEQKNTPAVIPIFAASCIPSINSGEYNLNLTASRQNGKAREAATRLRSLLVLRLTSMSIRQYRCILS